MSFAIIPGANAKVANDQFGDLPFAKGDVLLLQLEIGFARLRRHIARARVYGATSILNIAPFHPDCVALMAMAVSLSPMRPNLPMEPLPWRFQGQRLKRRCVILPDARPDHHRPARGGVVVLPPRREARFIPFLP